MMALLDLRLFVVDVRCWKDNRADCVRSMEAIALHEQHLRQTALRLLWSDDFFERFPWNQEGCPPELRDSCTVLFKLHEHVRANRRLILLDDVVVPDGTFTVEPNSLLSGYDEDLRLAWSWLFAWATDESRVVDGVAVPTLPRSDQVISVEARIVSDDARFKMHGAARLVHDDLDWASFVQKYKRPDLRRRRIAVLGGNRAPFERARMQLEEFGIDARDMIRLPPAYEETRTKQDTCARLENIDLLLVCTNRCKHTDTDHLDASLACTRLDLNSDGQTALVEAVLKHYRSLDT